MTSYFKHFLLAILLLPVTAMAQYTSFSDKLTAISDKMLQEHNDYFILVDAIRDGIINPNEQYNFSYLNGEITFNQKPINNDLRKAYEERMKQFFQVAGKDNRTMMSLRGSSIKMDDILNEKSNFRRNAEILKEHERTMEEHEKIAANHQKILTDMEEATRKNTEAGAIQTAYTDRIIAAMLKDGLVSKDKNIHIQWNLKGVFVNEKKLKGASAAKYNEMFEKEVGHKLLKPDDGVEITRN